MCSFRDLGASFPKTESWLAQLRFKGMKVWLELISWMFFHNWRIVATLVLTFQKCSYYTRFKVVVICKHQCMYFFDCFASFWCLNNQVFLQSIVPHPDFWIHALNPYSILNNITITDPLLLNSLTCTSFAGSILHLHLWRDNMEQKRLFWFVITADSNILPGVSSDALCVTVLNR